MPELELKTSTHDTSTFLIFDFIIVDLVLYRVRSTVTAFKQVKHSRLNTLTTDAERGHIEYQHM